MISKPLHLNCISVRFRCLIYLHWPVWLLVAKKIDIVFGYGVAWAFLPCLLHDSDFLNEGGMFVFSYVTWEWEDGLQLCYLEKRRWASALSPGDEEMVFSSVNQKRGDGLSLCHLETRRRSLALSPGKEQMVFSSVIWRRGDGLQLWHLGKRRWSLSLSHEDGKMFFSSVTWRKGESL